MGFWEYLFAFVTVCLMALAVILPLWMYLRKRIFSRQLLAQLKQAAAFLGFSECDSSLLDSNDAILLQDTNVIEGMSNTQVKGEHKYFFTLSAKDGDDTYFVPVFIFDVPNHLPHIVIISTINEEMAPPLIRKLPDQSHKYKAEGVFGDIFDAFLVSGSQSHALSLFSPEIMDILVSNFSDCSFEVINKRFYILAPADKNSDFDGSSWLNSANELASEIYKNSSGHDRSNNAIHSVEKIPVLKRGITNKHSFTILLLTLILALFVAEFLFEWSGRQSGYGLVFFGLGAILLLAPFLNALKRNEIKKKISNWNKQR